MNKTLHFLVADVHTEHVKMSIKQIVYSAGISKTMQKFHALNPVLGQ